MAAAPRVASAVASSVRAEAETSDAWTRQLELLLAPRPPSTRATPEVEAPVEHEAAAVETAAEAVASDDPDDLAEELRKLVAASKQERAREAAWLRNHL